MKVLKKFLSSRIGWVNEIQSINEYIYATNGIIAIRKVGTLDIESEVKISKNGIGALLDAFGYDKIDTKIFMNNDIKKQIDAIEKEKYYNKMDGKCECCDGTGEVEYDFNYDGEYYYHDADCPKCNGCGEIRIDEENALYRIDEKAVFKIFDKFIKVNNFDMILGIGDKIEISNTKMNHIICRIGEYEIVIMSTLAEHNEKENTFELKISI